MSIKESRVSKGCQQMLASSYSCLMPFLFVYELECQIAIRRCTNLLPRETVPTNYLENTDAAEEVMRNGKLFVPFLVLEKYSCLMKISNISIFPE